MLPHNIPDQALAWEGILLLRAGCLSEMLGPAVGLPPSPLTRLPHEKLSRSAPSAPEIAPLIGGWEPLRALQMRGASLQSWLGEGVPLASQAN